MAKPHMQAVPKQSLKVYQSLKVADSLTARQVAERLDILPHAVYRAIKPLIDLGMVEQRNTYPVSFQATPKPDAMNWFMRAAAQSFRQDFGSVQTKPSDPSLPSITFIKDREALLKVGEQEARKAKHKINYIVSGHKVPDSTVLAYRKASATGVKIRCIVQNNPTTTNASLEMYEEMGVEMRYLSNMGIRLFVFDGNTAIMSSYDEIQSNKAFGICFRYDPVAKQLDQLFEQRWLEAHPLPKTKNHSRTSIAV